MTGEGIYTIRETPRNSEGRAGVFGSGFLIVSCSQSRPGRMVVVDLSDQV